MAASQKPMKHFVKPVPFRATGKGYFNRIPNFRATKHTGNAVLTNLGLPPNHPHRQMWLFVTSISTGWVISGETGQSVYARTFYPQQLQQNDLVLNGIVANQYEYDRIAEFIQRHHDSALNAESSPGSFPLDFKLFPYRVPVGTNRAGATTWRYIHRGMHVEVYALAFAAGHERFINAPAWTVNCKVSNDFLQEERAVRGYNNENLSYQYVQRFGADKGKPFYKNPKAKGVYIEGPGVVADIEQIRAESAFWHSVGDTITDIF